MVDIRNVVRTRLLALFSETFELNTLNIEEVCAEAAAGRRSLDLCDLGCGDGIVTKRFARAAGTSKVSVVETWQPHVEAAEAQGFSVTRDDLNSALSLRSESFDIVVSNQVIEHLYDTERFVSEGVRLLKPGGTFVVSTENPASWHNIAALAIGWQPFSLANVSRRKAGIGNPLSLGVSESGFAFPMQHHRLFTPRALRELLVLEGLTEIRCRGAGYYPLPARLGSLDVNHAAFITVSGRKAP